MMRDSKWRAARSPRRSDRTGAARLIQQDQTMSPVEAPADGILALRDLDRPTVSEDDGAVADRGAAQGQTLVVRDARVRPSREAVLPTRNRLYEKVERIYDQVEAFVSRLSVRDN